MAAQKQSPAVRVAFMGLLFALAMALSFLESLIPLPPVYPAGFKLGLSNIVTMYCLFFLGAKDAYLLATLKSCFVLLTRGVVAAAMSFSGGIASVTVMLLLLAFKKLDLSYIFISVLGAVFHNVGQMFMASVLVGTSRVFYILPILVVSGVAMGIVTGILLRTVAPYMNKFNQSLGKGRS